MFQLCHIVLNFVLIYMDHLETFAIVLPKEIENVINYKVIVKKSLCKQLQET